MSGTRQDGERIRREAALESPLRAELLWQQSVVHNVDCRFDEARRDADWRQTWRKPCINLRSKFAPFAFWPARCQRWRRFR